MEDREQIPRPAISDPLSDLTQANIVPLTDKELARFIANVGLIPDGESPSAASRDLIVDRLLPRSSTNTAVPLSGRIASVSTAAGRQKLAEYLARRPFPHYEAFHESPDILVRIESDGTRTPGRFIGRDFQALK